ncbi:uncharacterized protein LOC103391293 [Cynoglossus semilaevis]|uniref:Uncharacterized LOC103391293 n=1 Tax=Cynoglossus semilaevis TaxID=244447 RepID=A0A3P8WGR1_CYNSE|nr:uncharacterized protein LOC103391293 [Cynoglossus semilaevis]XP_008325724.1 uncharacterized protein LOC103391293 [Cynoglossus semilaevis]
MLAKILQDMWVEPDLLEALSEEQKRILYLKMREEQVRRWREREEKEEREVGEDARPKKDSRKRVKWLLGRDGDVSVTVIGEIDEFRSSKLLQNNINNRLHSDNMNGIQTVDFLPGSQARELGFGGEPQLPLTDNYPPSPNDQTSSEEDVDSCSADDHLKDPVEDSDSESGSSFDNLSHWAPLRRPHPSGHGNQPPFKAQLSDTETERESERRDAGTDLSGGQRAEYGGIVAQLKKTFSPDPPSTTPAKPAHMQRRHAPLMR